MEGFQKVANRITVGLILAALIVGAALLMRVETTFRILGYPGLAILCFLAAAGGRGVARDADRDGGPEEPEGHRQDQGDRSRRRRRASARAALQIAIDEPPSDRRSATCTGSRVTKPSP